MGMSDITVKVAEGMFNYRVGAIIIDSDEILMVKNSGSSFFYTVGGRVQHGESAQEAILREAYEETQLHLEIERLAYIHENLFTMERTGTLCHEICMFFLMKPNKLLRAMEKPSFTEEYGDVAYHWLPIKGLESLRLFPEFFKTELLNLPSNTKYLVTKNETTFMK